MNLPPYVVLNDLTRGHPLRLMPLGAMWAQCRNLQSKEWRELRRWGIAVACFDALGPAWTDCNQFRVRFGSAS